MASHSVSSSSSAPQFRLHLLRRRGARHVRARAGGGGDGVSYLDMWRKAVDRERRSEDLARRLGGAPLPPPEPDDVRAKTARFGEMLRVPREERDRAQRLQVIDRAAAAIAAARALLRETLLPPAPETATQEVGSPPPPGDPRPGFEKAVASGSAWAEVTNLNAGDSFPNKPEAFGLGTPGPDFWSWSPPVESSSKLRETDTGLKPSKKKSYAHRPDLFMEEEQSVDVLSLPFESSLFKKNEDRSHPHFEDQSLPPFQSFIELQTVASETLQAVDVEEKFEAQFSKNAAEAARALDTAEEESSHGVYPDGSMWWKETGVEERPDGVICKWTIIRGVSADGAVEWEDKYWEASDQFDYKELGSEKSGRDAAGNVWREYWKESMWQDFTCGIMHMEKTADKWGTNAKEDQWREQWWEHYDATGKAEKWADKWCSLDPNTPLDIGHAHVWHERWGEKYDGNGGSTKYTDKWAERSEEDGGWSKWGDKWDEHFGPDGHGVKQGETWWEGRHGDRWNRTWGEGHNCSGWVHKYGRSSGGEHWDTHVPQDTWYERHPHFGFEHCFNNSGQLRAVRRQPRP